MTTKHPTYAASERGGPDAAGARRTHPRLLEILVCPVTKTTLSYNAERQELISKAANLAFPIKDGVPLMTVEAARSLDQTKT